MKHARLFLYTGIIISLVIHGALFVSFVQMGKRDAGTKKAFKPSILVPVTITEHKKPPPPPVKKKPLPKKIVKKKKKPPVRITKKTKVNPAPVSHKRTEKKKKDNPADIKPVFGVTKKTVKNASAKNKGIGVRVGNTLMKEQEEEYTPPEKVRDYITIPVFDLTTLPLFKVRVTPEFPGELKEKELEGEVFLSASIDDLGTVNKVTVLKTDHVLFAKAAVKALLASRFVPATQNGEPVGTILDDLVYTFVLDD